METLLSSLVTGVALNVGVNESLPPKKTKRKRAGRNVYFCQWWEGTALVSLLRVLCMSLFVHSWETIPRIAVCAIKLFVHLFLQSCLFCKGLTFFSNQIVSPDKNFHATLGNLLQSSLFAIQSCFLLLLAGKNMFLLHYLQLENISNFRHLESSFPWID